MVQHQFESFSPRHGDVVVVVDFDEKKRRFDLQVIAKATNQAVIAEKLRSARNVEGYLFGRQIEVPEEVIDALEADVEEATMFGTERRVVFHDQCTLH